MNRIKTEERQNNIIMIVDNDKELLKCIDRLINEKKLLELLKIKEGLGILLWSLKNGLRLWEDNKEVSFYRKWV